MSASPEARARHAAAARHLHLIQKERDALLAPTNERLWAAEEALSQIEDETGPAVGECEFCSVTVFDGERHSSGPDGILCLSCSPSYEDMQREPGLFLNGDDEFHTAESVRPIIGTHLAAGGALTDKLV